MMVEPILTPLYKMYFGWAVVVDEFVSHFLGYRKLVVAFGIFIPFMAESLVWGRGCWAAPQTVITA